jgi:hypothetical protein
MREDRIPLEVISMELAAALAKSPEPWTSYAALTGLLGMSESAKEVITARVHLLSHPFVLGLINELSNWPGEVLASHKSAKQSFHKLSFLADIGIKADDTGMPAVINKLKEHVSDEGFVQLPTCIPEHYGGTGVMEWAWAACDAPIILYALAKMGLKEDPQVRRGVSSLLKLSRAGGWGCTVSKELGNFRGPGRKSDPCPYVNLIMLKLLSLYDDLKSGAEARTAVDCLLDLWENSLVSHPYIFYMGNDFRKLKAPFIWYDILHVVEALSYYKDAASDARFKYMLSLVNSKSGPNGLFTPESVWLAWKGWDFGQTKGPSSWMSLLIARINKRVEENLERSPV